MSEFSRKKYLIRAVDDEQAFLDALRYGLEAEGWRVDTYTDPKQFLRELDINIPGCAILDIKMPDLTGPELQELLRERGVSLSIIFLTGHGNMNAAIHAFRNGAVDFLQKPVDLDELLVAIEKAIAKQEEYLRMLAEMSPLTRWESLTDQQRRVVEDMASGLEREDIVEHLGISPRTLQRHRQYAMKKLGLKDPSGLASFLEAVREEIERSRTVQKPFSSED